MKSSLLAAMLLLASCPAALAQGVVPPAPVAPLPAQRAVAAPFPAQALGAAPLPAPAAAVPSPAAAVSAQSAGIPFPQQPTAPHVQPGLAGNAGSQAGLGNGDTFADRKRGLLAQIQTRYICVQAARDRDEIEACRPKPPTFNGPGLGQGRMPPGGFPGDK